MILFVLLIMLSQEVIEAGDPCSSCSPFIDIINLDGAVINKSNTPSIDNGTDCLIEVIRWDTQSYKVLVMVDITGKDDYQAIDLQCGWMTLICDNDNQYWNLLKFGFTQIEKPYRVYKIKARALQGWPHSCSEAYCMTCPPLSITKKGFDSIEHAIAPGHYDGQCANIGIQWKTDADSKLILTFDVLSSDNKPEKVWMALKCKTQLKFFCNNQSDWILKMENGTNLLVNSIVSEALDKTEQRCNYDLCKLCKSFQPELFVNEMMYVDGIDEDPGCLKRELSWQNPNRSKIEVTIVDNQDKVFNWPFKCNQTLLVTCNQEGIWEINLEGQRKIAPKRIASTFWTGTEGKCDEKPCGTCTPFDGIINDDRRINYSIQYKKGTDGCLHGSIKWFNKDKSKISLNITTRDNISRQTSIKCEEATLLLCTQKREWKRITAGFEALRSIRPKILRDTQGKCDLEDCNACRSLNRLLTGLMPDIKIPTNQSCTMANLTWKSKDNEKILLIIQTHDKKENFYYKDEQIITLSCSSQNVWQWEEKDNSSSPLIFIEALVLIGSQGKADSELCDTCPRDFNFIMGDGKPNIEERVDKDGCGIADIKWYTTERYKMELHVYLDDNSIKPIDLRSHTSIQLVCTDDRRWKWKESEEDAPIPISSLITRIIKGSENRSDEDVCNTCTKSDLNIMGLADWDLQYSIDDDGCGIGSLTWQTKDKSKISLDINLHENETRTILLNCSSMITISCNHDRKWMWNDTVSEELVTFVSMRSEIIESSANKCDSQMCSICPKFDRPITGDGIPNIMEGINDDGCAVTSISWTIDDNYKLYLIMKIEGGGVEKVELFCNTTLTFHCNEKRKWIWKAEEASYKFYKMRLKHATASEIIESLETKAVSDSQGRCDERVCSMCDAFVSTVSGDVDGIDQTEVAGCARNEIKFKNENMQVMEAIWKDDKLQEHQLPIRCINISDTREWPKIAWECGVQRKWQWTKDSIPNLPPENTDITIKVWPSVDGACDKTTCQICKVEWDILLNSEQMKTDSIGLYNSSSKNAQDCLELTIWLGKAQSGQIATGFLTAIGKSGTVKEDFLYCDGSIKATVNLKNLTIECSNEAKWLFKDSNGADIVLDSLSYKQGNTTIDCKPSLS